MSKSGLPSSVGMFPAGADGDGVDKHMLCFAYHDNILRTVSPSNDRSSGDLILSFIEL